MGPARAEPPTGLSGTSILLVTGDIGARARLTRALRGFGVHVAERRHGPPPAVDVVLVDARTEAQTRKELDVVRGDVRMRWASVVHVDFERAAPPGGVAADLDPLIAVVEPAVAPDRVLLRRLLDQNEVSLRLSPLGPIRILRAVAASGRTMHLHFKGTRGEGQVDMADGLVVCAFSEADDRRLEGGIALAPLLDMDDALVTITSRAHPAAVNIMEPVDQALELAAVERQSLMQPLPANDTGALLKAAAEADVDILGERGGSGMRASGASERPTLGDEPDALTPEDDLPSIHPVDDMPTAPPMPQQPRVPQVAVGSSEKKFVKTMMGAVAPHLASGVPRPPASPGGPPVRPATPPAADVEVEPLGPQTVAPSAAAMKLMEAEAEAGPSTQPAPSAGQAAGGPVGRTLWGVAPPPLSGVATSSAAGLPSPDPTLSMPPPAPAAVAQARMPADAFAGTQLGMQSPFADVPKRPSRDDEPTNAHVSLSDTLADEDPPDEPEVSEGPEDRQAEGAIHAESDGLGIAFEDAAAAESVEVPQRSVVSESEAPLAAVPGRLGIAGETTERTVVAESGSREQPRGAGVRAGLAVLALAMGIGGGIFLWNGQHPSEATRADDSVPALEAPVKETAVASGRVTSAQAIPVKNDEVVEEEVPAVGDVPLAVEEPKKLAGGAEEATTVEAAEEATTVESEEVEQDASGSKTQAEAATTVEPERDKRGSDRVCATAWRAERSGALDEAMALYEQGRELDGRNPRAFEGIARISLKRGDNERALEAAERAVDLRSRRASYRVLLGDALMAAGREGEARSAWQKALELDPEEADAQQRLN